MTHHDRRRSGAGEAGITLPEVALTLLLLMPLIGVLISSGKLVVGSLGASEVASGIAEAIERTARRIERVLRAGRVATLKIRAVQQDVDDGFAALVGEWIPARDYYPRQGVELMSTGGEASTDITAPSVLQRIEFVMEATESDNGVDDDGDGLVDEGVVRWQSATAQVDLLSGVETCDFTPEGRLIRFSLRCARRAADGEVRRTTVNRNFYVRNE